jgi:hypothetical protein
VSKLSRRVLVLTLLLTMSALAARSQLVRVGSRISVNESKYFGLARNGIDVDSILVINDVGVTLVGMRDDSLVYSVKFTADEVPILERYLRDYERMLLSEVDLFIGDTGIRKILIRVAPEQHYYRIVPRVSVQLSNGTITTGVPLAATDERLILSKGSSFDPLTDLRSDGYHCIPVALITGITSDVDELSPRWLVVQGDVRRFRTAIRVISPDRVYMTSVPPEVETCASNLLNDEVDGAPLNMVLPRSNVRTLAAFGGFVESVLRPTALVVRSAGGTSSESELSYQPKVFSSGVEYSVFVSQFYDLGVRAVIHAQPSTIGDSSQQNSLGADSYSLHLTGTWNAVPIDSVGFNRVGLSTTFAVGSSFVDYRARTFFRNRNLTSTGFGITLDAALNASLTVALTRSFAVGVRCFAWGQYGIYSAIDSITHNVPFDSPHRFSFNVDGMSVISVGAHLFASYVL